MSGGFRPVMLDDSPLLLEQSYRLRFQVYCVERQFLSAVDYPNQLEFDEFDRDSVHVGVMDAEGHLAGTARLVRSGSLGLPMFQHCTLFPNETVLDDVGNMVVEVSRVSISRHYARRRDDGPFGGTRVPDANDGDLMRPARERRRRGAEPFITLLKSIIHGAKRMGATHLIGATDAALHRWLVHYGFPYRLAGPEVDYYGLIAPHVMSLVDLDQVILGGRFAALDGFPVGLEPGRWPRLDEREGEVAGALQVPLVLTNRPVDS